MTDNNTVRNNVTQIATELAERCALSEGHILVIGCSTSEVAGSRIGTAGTQEIAEALFSGIDEVRQKYGFALAFQCCEHLNRALVVERSTQKRWGLEEVSAIPVHDAGGAMATIAYRTMDDPCLVATIQADAGMDIGHTLIGMHLRRVAVPFRTSLSRIGAAHVVTAFTRPMLIGGERAVYKRT